MDCRTRVAVEGKWYDEIDERRMVATVVVDDGESDPVSIDVPLTAMVCGTCQGKGKCVNPSIDAHGICEDEWQSWSQEERDDYLNGGCDVTCPACDGKRVVFRAADRLTPEERRAVKIGEDRISERLADYRTMCMEDGRYGDM